MPTKAQIRLDSKRSESREIRLFFSKAKEFYKVSSREGEELYDTAFKVTREFRNIHGSIIQEHPRIVKILRYLLVPAVSQMKLGQMVGLASTASIENGRPVEFSPANALARIIRNNFDRDRLVWQQARMNSATKHLAKSYVKKWTISLMANQNSATDFRNWRKDLQENQVERAIIDASYRLLPERRVVRNVHSLPPGTFLKESKIGTRSPQKADFVVRLKRTAKLVAIEAKAVGVRIDAYKRIKEVRDKSATWQKLLGTDIQTAAVIAGFIPASEVETLIRAPIPFFWEHDLGKLTDFLERK